MTEKTNCHIKTDVRGSQTACVHAATHVTERGHRGGDPCVDGGKQIFTHKSATEIRNLNLNHINNLWCLIYIYTDVCGNLTLFDITLRCANKRCLRRFYKCNVLYILSNTLNMGLVLPVNLFCLIQTVNMQPPLRTGCLWNMRVQLMLTS